MVLEKIYMIPHGDEIIDIPDKESMEINKLLVKMAGEDRADVLVILSPHGINLSKNIGIINTENFEANTKLKTKILAFNARNERELTEDIIKIDPDTTEEARFITYAGELSVFPLDFGSSIPLYFFKQRNIVVIGQSRLYDRDKLLNFGKLLCRAVQSYNKKVSIIISADQAHTHSDKGPYGYSPYAEIYESVVKSCFQKNSFEGLYSIDQKIIDNGKPDSFWNLMVMYGILQESNKKMHLDYSYVEIYFGMMLAHSI
ncbi:MAG: hypothetical protein QXZ44_06675 [Ferroplasma sp.]